MFSAERRLVCDFSTILFRSRIRGSAITPRDDWGLIKRELTNLGLSRSSTTGSVRAVNVVGPCGGSFATIEKLYRVIEIIDFLYRPEWPKYVRAYAGHSPLS